jgi:thioredoxin-related protein
MKIQPILITFFLCNTLFAQVQFSDQPFEAIVGMAGESGKLVMVDAYTDWCGWCKVMDKETFADKATGDYINEKFVSTKVNMEVGFGVMLAMKYRVSYYPQYLFFDGEGHFIGRLGGFKKPEPFMKDVEALINGKDRLAPLPNPMNFTEGFPDFYINSFKTGKEKVNPTPEQITAWLANHPDLTDEPGWGVLSRFVGGGEFGGKIIELREELIAKYGRSEVIEKLSALLFSDVKLAIKERNPAYLEGALGAADHIMGEDAEMYKQRYRQYYYQMTENWVAFADEGMLRAQGDIKENAYALNDMAWTLYQKCADIECLDKAASWMQKVSDEAPQFAYLDTYASILYKANRRDEALAIAERALELGAKEEEDTTATKDLIAKLKKMP